MEPAVTLLRVVLSFAGPILAGWLLLRALLPQGSAGLRLGLGAGLGMGLAGTVYSLVIALTDSAAIAFAATEAVLAAGILILVLILKRVPSAADGLVPKDSNVRGIKFAFIMTAILAGATVFMMLDLYHDGDFDAVAIWNMKALFMVASEDPLAWMNQPALHDIQRDYPLLLPSLVTRGWQYAGSTSTLIPQGIAVLFAVSTLLLLIGGLQILSTRRQAYLAACLLLGTPFFLLHSISQYADVPLAFFMTASVLLLSIYDSRSGSGWKLLFLAGLAAGFAACTKNEGILFVVVLLATRVLLALWRRDLRRGPAEFALIGCGLLLGLLAVAAFKTIVAQPNHLAAQLNVTQLMERIPVLKLHAMILEAFLMDLVRFGQWLILPLPFVLIHVLTSWRRITPEGGKAAWLTPALLLSGMAAGHYLVYLITPYDLKWHLDSSLPRLTLQIWPVSIALYSMLADPAVRVNRTTVSTRHIATIAAVFLAFVATVGTIIWMDSERPVIRPRLVLSRSVVHSGESYILKIEGLINSEVLIRYSIDNEPSKTFVVQLDSRGETRLDVSDSTRTGSYRLLAFRKAGDQEWIDSDAVIVVN